METRQLGASDLHITPIGLGAWAIGGGGYAFGWGPQDDADSIATIHRALDLGINWIDTAAVYGYGRSERVVRQALEGRAGTRPYLFTKGSLRWDAEGRLSHSLKADSLREEVDASLARLGADVIDLYQVHWPAFPGTSEAPDLEEGWDTLARMQREGKLRHIGVSNFSVPQLERIAAIAPVTSVQPPYSILRPGVEADVLPYCRAHDVGVIVYSPMQAGLLTGTMTRERVTALPPDDWRRGNRYFQEPYLSRALAVADGLREIGQRHGRSAAEVAVAWTLRHPAVTGAIVGARRPGQVDGFIGAAGFQLAEAEIEEIARAAGA